jgi:hypothetical protein
MKPFKLDKIIWGKKESTQLAKLGPHLNTFILFLFFKYQTPHTTNPTPSVFPV